MPIAARAGMRLKTAPTAPITRASAQLRAARILRFRRRRPEDAEPTLCKMGGAGFSDLRGTFCFPTSRRGPQAPDSHDTCTQQVVQVNQPDGTAVLEDEQRRDGVMLHDGDRLGRERLAMNGLRLGGHQRPRRQPLDVAGPLESAPQIPVGDDADELSAFVADTRYPQPLRRHLQQRVLEQRPDLGQCGRAFGPDAERAGEAEEVDGGVDTTNAAALVEAGASILVAGAAIFRAPDLAKATRDLRQVAAGVS